jgi:peptide/nickel transport system permease protein
MNVVFTILQRLAGAAGLLAAVAILNFLLIHVAPGDVVEAIVGDMGGASQSVIRSLRDTYGLDLPLHLQLVRYLAHLVHGDLGTSAYLNRPVLGLILERVPATALLVLSALVIALVIGTLLGVVSARFPRSWFSAFVNIVSLFGFSAPVFWSGLMLLLLFAVMVPVVPTGGMFDVARDTHGLAYAADVAHHLILPAVTLASIYLALYARLARASMLEVMGSDYIRTARAKGLPERVVVLKHALRNALMPIVTVAGLQFSGMIAGAVLVETVFNWPGMGLLAYESILRHDNQLILGILLLSAVMVIIGNMLTDVVYRLVDPRVDAGR